MTSKSIKLNFFYNIILQMSKVIFPLITTPYVARVLEPEGVGLSNFASTYAGYFALFAALGLPTYGIREIAKTGNDKISQTKFVSEAISLTIITTLFCVIFFLISVFCIPQLNENFLIFAISALGLYISPFKIDWYFQGKEEFGYITFRSLIIKVISIICLFIFVNEKEDLLNFVIINAACTSVNELWNYIKLYKTGIHPYFTLHFSKHLKPLLILFSSSIAISIYTVLDTLMLGFMTSYDEVAYYNSATNISKTILPIATSLAAVVMPRMAFYLKENNWQEMKTLLNKSLSVVSFLSFPLTFALIAIAPIFIPLFYGEQFIGAVLPIQIVAGVIISIGFNNLFGVQILVGLGKDKLFLYAVLVGTFSNFILNLVLIPLLGASGASISTVIAETLILFVEIWLVQKYTNVRFNLGNDVIICFLVSLLFFPLIHILSYLTNNWILIGCFTVIGTFIYLSLLYLLKNAALLSFIAIIKKRIKI